MLMELTPEQRERIRLVLEEELRCAYRTALGRGADPGEVAELVAARRHALRELAAGFPDDPQHPADDAGEGSGVREQR